MRIRTTRRFDWDPPEHGGRTTITLKADREYVVRGECGRAAIVAGAATEILAPTAAAKPEGSRRGRRRRAA